MSDNFPLLSLEDPDSIIAYVQQAGWMEEVTRVEKAGEGNMNLVVRLHGPSGSLILKQSRPFVEKYPSIPAPPDRLLVEVAFYEAVGGEPVVRQAMPALIAVDRAHRIAVMADLGEASDCTDVYAGAPLEAAPLMAWLTALHDSDHSSELRDRLRNREMRALNHAHIFDLPMTGAHGMDLNTVTPGLQQAAETFRNDTVVQARVSALGERYLDDGPRLLHGDYYPGSWLRTAEGLRIIDPEFGFFGPAEFDLGVFKAHLIMAGLDASGALEHYGRAFDHELTDAFAGTEIMRRLIGVAQLPMNRSLEEKVSLLETSARLITG
ncbi:MAG: phosphotransferase [Rhodothermales bacterium]|nr:phosphotransferase [Rhodothermales bacterium]MBO6779233.1 phosphotransferase [Rhodothermales bacterium]